MKKLRLLSLLLCAALLCQIAIPASAAETGASAQETQPTEQQAAQIPFGGKRQPAGYGAGGLRL